MKSLKDNKIDVWSADKDLPVGTRHGPAGDIKPEPHVLEAMKAAAPKDDKKDAKAKK